MDKKDYLRSLSSVNDLLQAFTSAQGTPGGIPRNIAVESIRVVVEGVREAIQAAKDEVELSEIKTDVDDLLPLVEEEVRERLQNHLRRVVNATGVVLHTNLGRSVLPPEALESIRAAAEHYSNLELDLETGERGSRHSHVEQLLCELTGAEAAMAVNNNAGAVLLALTAHARGRSVVVSRGQLIEIGGSFRIPEVMEQSGARLVEVGATNRTRISDFRAAVGEDTAMLMRAHPSNYRIIGFTEETPLAEMSALAQERGLILLDDLGSGVLIDLGKYGLPPEPTPTQSLKEGADLVTFSGDKLLGGPQAGIVVGRKELVRGMARHPLARALRIDKLTLAALEAVLRLYLEPDGVTERVPTLAMLTLPPEELKRRARKLAKGIGGASDGFEVEMVESSSQAGGGSLPATLIPTWVVSVTSRPLTANQLEERLRASDPPVIVRIHEDRVLLDPRTLKEDEYELVRRAFARIAAGPEE